MHFDITWAAMKIFLPHSVGTVETSSLTSSALEENFLSLPTECGENFFAQK